MYLSLRYCILSLKLILRRLKYVEIIDSMITESIYKCPFEVYGKHTALLSSYVK